MQEGQITMLFLYNALNTLYLNICREIRCLQSLFSLHTEGNSDFL